MSDELLHEYYAKNFSQPKKKDVTVGLTEDELQVLLRTVGLLQDSAIQMGLQILRLHTEVENLKTKLSNENQNVTVKPDLTANGVMMLFSKIKSIQDQIEGDSIDHKKI